MKKTLIEKPDAIILTMPVKFFRDYPGGMERFRRTLAMVDAGQFVWNQTISSIPKHEVLWCYLCIDGRIQYRLNISHYEKGAKEFNDPTPTGERVVRRFSDSKKWGILCGPVQKAPKDLPMKGFRGFRYTNIIF
jgi:hypothetical protein